MYPQLVDVLDLPYLMEACIVDGAFDAALGASSSPTRALLLLNRPACRHSRPRAGPAAPARRRRRPGGDQRGRRPPHGPPAGRPARQARGAGPAARRADHRRAHAPRAHVGRASSSTPPGASDAGRVRRFTEVALRTQFLQRREAWLEARLAGEVAASPLALLSKYLDVSRVHLFEIATQYQAMFADDDDDDGLLQRWWVAVPSRRPGTLLTFRVVGQDQPPARRRPGEAGDAPGADHERHVAGHPSRAGDVVAFGGAGSAPVLTDRCAVARPCTAACRSGRSGSTSARS